MSLPCSSWSACLYQTGSALTFNSACTYSSLSCTCTSTCTCLHVYLLNCCSICWFNTTNFCHVSQSRKLFWHLLSVHYFLMIVIVFSTVRPSHCVSMEHAPCVHVLIGVSCEWCCCVCSCLDVAHAAHWLAKFSITCRYLSGRRRLALV